MTVRRSRADSRHEQRFGSSVQHTGFTGSLHFAKEGGVYSVLTKAAADLLNGGITDPDLLLDVGIRAGSCFAAGIGEQQNTGAFAFPVGMFLGAGDDFDFVALFLREDDTMFLGGHRGLPPHRMRREYPEIMPAYYRDELLGMC